MKSEGTFIITGGSRGLGATLAEFLIGQGISVALIARNAESLEAVRKLLERKNQKQVIISTHSADLCDENQAETAISEILNHHEKISCLVNNAATWQGTAPTSSLVRSTAQKSIDQNFYTALNATQSLLKRYKPESSRELNIVNIGATSSKEGWDPVAAFCIGKNALRIYSQALARELGPKGIHVSHLIVDGVLDNTRTQGLNPDRSKESFIDQAQLSETILNITRQHSSCWTFELDVRPFNENW